VAETVNGSFYDSRLAFRVRVRVKDWAKVKDWVRIRVMDWVPTQLSHLDFLRNMGQF
jgi:hypothetical protein